jgi:3'-phosphoadenosine 5'-phosphosulfate sulfotransferase (PAPS reductase)/FAD synthetase
MSTPQTFLFPGRRIVWFSCGAASAVAAKLTSEKYNGAVEIIYCDTSKNEHPSNARFRTAVEHWIGLPVQIVANPLYATVEEVFDARNYMSGPAGAPCTVELKKKPRFAYQHPEDTHVFGLTVDEGHRIARFERDNHELFLEWPLRDAGITKPDTLRMIEDVGIELPLMYQLGYANNNCIGCVKAQSPHYWNKIRSDFPDVFARRAEQSRRIGARLVRLRGERIFLDELPANAAEVVTEDLSCGPQCKQDEDEALAAKE